VLDVAVLQLVFEAVFKFLNQLHGAGFVDDKVGGQGIFGCTDGPDVDVMNIFDVVHAGDSFFDLADLDSGGDAVEGQAKAVAQQLPGAIENYDGDDEAEGGVDPIEVGIEDDEAADDEAGGYDSVGEEVEEGAPDIEVAFLVPKEEHGGQGVNRDADGGDDGDGLAGQGGFGGHEPVERLIADGADGKQEDGGIEQGYEDGGLFESVGIFFGCADAEEADGDQGHGEACYVCEVVTGVG